MKVWIVVEDWNDLGVSDWHITVARNLDELPGIIPWENLHAAGDSKWLWLTYDEAAAVSNVAKEHCPGVVHIVEVDVD